jgi:hypothetical protein
MKISKSALFEIAISATMLNGIKKYKLFTAPKATLGDFTCKELMSTSRAGLG